jgi:ADP-ribose pyrophosphatase YjhB (NUDIX family)
MQHDHCSYCGTRYGDRLPWPRTCTGCGETTWSNPLPVAVVLLPVSYEDGRTGIIVVRRNIEPFRGEIALPGGFIETGESWQEAAVRELEEETGLVANPGEVELFDVHSSYKGYTLMVFCTLPPRPAADLPPSVPNEESMEWFAVTEPTPLCFPTHTQSMARYFDRLLAGAPVQAPAQAASA